jgi:hypothetical protein
VRRNRRHEPGANTDRRRRDRATAQPESRMDAIGGHARLRVRSAARGGVHDLTNPAALEPRQTVLTDGFHPLLSTDNTRFAEHRKRTRLGSPGAPPSPRVRCLLACFTHLIYILTYTTRRGVRPARRRPGGGAGRRGSRFRSAGRCAGALCARGVHQASSIIGSMLHHGRRGLRARVY